MPNPDPAGSEFFEVRASGVHGRGVFALQPMRRGKVIGRYEGRRYASVDADQRDGGLTYLFTLSDGSYIDGAEGGNATRCINHSCDPNCAATEYWRPDGSLGVKIHATRAIAAGEELFIDYALVIAPGDEPGRYPCHCGAPACRRTLASVAVGP